MLRWSAHLYEKTNVQTNKKQDVYKVAANQILNWHIYISFTKSEISYKPYHCRHLARVFAVRMYSDSHQVPLYAWHNNTSHQCQSIVVLLADAAYIWKYIYILYKKDKFEQLRKILILIKLASSEASDKPAHMHSFARVITARTHKVGTYMSRGTWFPTMWHFDKCRLRRACAASFKLRNSKWCSVSRLTTIEYSSN